MQLQGFAHFIALLMSFLAFSNLSFSSPVKDVFVAERGAAQGKYDLHSLAERPTLPASACVGPDCSTLSASSGIWSTEPVHNHPRTSALSVRGPTSLTLVPRASSFFHNLGDYAIRILYARLLYPIYSAAADLSRIYAAFVAKSKEIETQYPPLAKLTFKLGGGELTMTCPDPMSWGTVLGILETLKLIVDLGWTVTYRVFVPAFTVWVAFSFAQQPRPGDPVGGEVFDRLP